MCEGYLTVANAFVDYYKGLLGSVPISHDFDSSLLKDGPRIHGNEASYMCRTVTDREILEALKSIDYVKSPGPDGYNSKFFIACWNIVGQDFCNAIREFFDSGKLLKQVNATFIALIPKMDHVDSVSDFRPISLCNVIYKTITKILANRIKKVISRIVGPEQGAFVPDRDISDNILLAHELVKNYDRKASSPRICIKVDLKKAFDSVSWVFLEQALIYFGFPARFTHWIMTCVSSSYFSVLVNGSPNGFFPGARGLRQGDPLSPSLFVLCIEVLSRLLRNLKRPDFAYDPKCVALGLNHLVFADDLLVFARGDFSSVLSVKKCLDIFANWSGLSANPLKTGFYCGGIDDVLISDIVDCTHYQKEEFPFRYLGIPLNSSRLTKAICAPLLDKIREHTRHWSTKLLSYAGKLRLINSVIFGLINFWGSSFMLSSCLLDEIQRLCSQFFWNSYEHHRIIFFSWDRICKPKKEGGFNIKELLSWNKALCCKWFYKILTYKGIWAAWTIIQHINLDTFWSVSKKDGDTVAWKNLLDIRDEIIDFAGSTNNAFRLFSSWVSNGSFRTTAAYDFFRGKREEVAWSRVVWCPTIVPSHTIISIWAISKTLPTPENYRKRGFEGPSWCVLCKSEEESNSHLFFACPFSRNILQVIKQ